MVTATFRVDAYLSGSWTDITSDVLRSGLRHHHGIDGNDPLDVVAGSGEFQFELRNDAQGSRPVGYYSPGHANVRTGWDYGVKIRVVYNNGADRTRWSGKVAEIGPDADPKGRRTVRVVAYDHQHDLLEADVRAITPQVNQTESALIGVVLDAVATDSQPPSRSLATGLDTIPLVFDKLGERTKAISAIADVVRSSFGIYYTSGAGVGTYKTRQQRFTTSSIATLTDSDISAFEGPTSREGSFNVVRVTYHPKHQTAGIVLWSYSGSSPQVIRAGETITVWTPYRDPNQTNVAIGASAVTTPVAGTDYVAKEFADGTGDTLTANLTVTANKYTTGTEWEIENTGTKDAHIGGTAGAWQIRGTGIFDDGEQAVESRSAQPYGERVLSLDLKYLADRHVAYGMAQLVREQRENPATLPREVGFYATRNSTLMSLALTAEIGDIITLSNAMTGVSSATCAIQRIELEPVLSTTSNTIVALYARFSVTPTSSLTAPGTPTGLAVANTSDSELTPSWTNTDATAETEVYVDGTLATIAAAGATSILVQGLTRATNYTVTLKHVKYALLRSSATAGVVGRPTVTATGGTITTPGDGYKYHTFTTSGNFAITGRGRVDYFLMGGGAGGGASTRTQIGGGGGAGGYYFLSIDNDEPTSASAGFPSGFPVAIGAAGAGATGSDNQGTSGNATTYRSDSSGSSGGGGSHLFGASNDGATGATGGGGAGEGGDGGDGTIYDGGAGSTAGSGERPGGGGAGAGGVGGNGVDGSTSGGTEGAGLTQWGTLYGRGGKGGGSGESPGNGALYGEGGDGVVAAVDGVAVSGKNGAAGIAIFRYPI
jgi:hypothetical protein